MEPSELQSGSAIRSHRLVRAIIVIISIIILLLSGFLLLFPPWGMVAGGILFIAVVAYNINIMSSVIIIEDDGLRQQSLFATKEYKFDKLKKIKSMKVLGTVANSPFAIRSVVFEYEDDEFITMNTVIYPWYLILDLLDYLVKNDKIEEIEENQNQNTQS